jgi:hypothetical protein
MAMISLNEVFIEDSREIECISSSPFHNRWQNERCGREPAFDRLTLLRRLRRCLPA